MSTDMNISDVYTIASALIVAVRSKKVFTDKETAAIYPIWSKVMAFCEKTHRSAELAEITKTMETDAPPTDAVLENTE